MKRGLLLTSGDVGATISSASHLGYDGVEVALNSDIHDMTKPQIHKWVEECAEAGMYFAAHAPSMDLRLDSSNSGIRAESVRQLQLAIQLVGDDARYLTIHTGFARRFAKSGGLERVVLALALLADEASDYGLSLCVENVYEGSVDELLDYIDLADRKNLFLTLDVAHAIAYGKFDPLVALNVMSDRILNVHLSDNNGFDDQHLALGKGCVPLPESLRFLQSSGYEGYVTVESLSPRDAKLSLDYIRQLDVI